MRRSFLLAAACTIISVQAASAADMPTKAPAYAPVAMYNWSGLYVGVNAGYGWGRFSDSVGGINVNGFVGGGQLGYNWQTGNLVFGLETDFQGSGQSATQAGTILGTAVSVTERIRYFGTVRGRLGFASDRWLAYVTGGFAYVNGGLDLTVAGVTMSDNTTKGGGVVGAGIEYAFAGPWTGALEYLYIDTGTRSVTVLGITDNVRTRDSVLRAKLNYRF
jgi:outer membrane immunogenic protein